MVFVSACSFIHMFLNITCDKVSLFKCVIKLLKLDFLSLTIFCPETLLLSPNIIRNYRIRCIQNRLCRAVILLQFNHMRILKHTFKIQNILDICPTEFVNRLVVIPDHTKILIFPRQNANQPKLHRIGILILVHHDVTETFLIIFQNIRLCLQQLNGLHQQIIKIQRIVCPHLFFIFPIHFCNLLLIIISFCIQFILLW